MAVLAALRLLEQLPPSVKSAIQCISFACPAIGNAALVAYVQQRGWNETFTNLVVPGQPLDPKSMTSMGPMMGLAMAHMLLQVLYYPQLVGDVRLHWTYTMQGCCKCAVTYAVHCRALLALEACELSVCTWADLMHVWMQRMWCQGYWVAVLLCSLRQSSSMCSPSRRTLWTGSALRTC